jgi:hypothetical protein
MHGSGDLEVPNNRDPVRASNRKAMPSVRECKLAMALTLSRQR